MINSTEDLNNVINKTEEIYLLLEKDDKTLSEKQCFELEKSLHNIFINSDFKTDLSTKEYSHNINLKITFINKVSKFFSIFLDNSMFKEFTTNLALILCYQMMHVYNIAVTQRRQYFNIDIVIYILSNPNYSDQFKNLIKSKFLSHKHLLNLEQILKFNSFCIQKCLENKEYIGKIL